MIRFPDGITKHQFFQKHWEHKLPEFIETITVYSESKQENGEYLLCNNLPTLLWLAQSDGPKSDTAIFAWNLFGTADLILAIFLGVTSAEGSPLQLFHAAPGSAAMQYLPWSFVPTVLVPFWLILHAIIWAQLRRRVERRQTANAAA